MKLNAYYHYNYIRFVFLATHLVHFTLGVTKKNIVMFILLYYKQIMIKG